MSLNRPFFLSTFLLVALSAIPLSAQVTGTWNGTYNIVVPDCPGAFNGPSTLYAVQSGSTFTAILDIAGIDDCAVSPVPLALPVSGTVSGNTVAGMILGPFEAPSLPFTGTISGNAMTATFTESNTVTNLALTRSSSDPPAGTITGTYSGTYSITEFPRQFPCKNLTSFSYSGALSASLLQAGPRVSAILEMANLKDDLHDEDNNCTIVDKGAERAGLMATLAGNTLTGAIVTEGGLPVTATVNGETISGTGSDAEANVTFTMTRIATALSPVVLDFDADPTSIRSGEASTLSWTVFNALSVSIDHGVGTRAPVDTIVVFPPSTTTYALTATGSNAATATARMTVIVRAADAPEIVSFTATPSVIQPGGCSTLAWSTRNTTSVSIDQGIGSQPVNGSTSVCPASTKSYTLTASGEGGSTTGRATVTVAEPWQRRRSVRH
ncbi:MAG TPA: hypothetical protein VFO89_03020 [Thermoanaerobaculia bacterium]|nr:hypothetical protein [Thermoanaerobaculia bacterium]